MEITIKTFTYLEPEDNIDLCICAECAAQHPELKPQPFTYVYSPLDELPLFCDYCVSPIIEIYFPRAKPETV